MLSSVRRAREEAEGPTMPRTVSTTQKGLPRASRDEAGKPLEAGGRWASPMSPGPQPPR